MQHRQQLVFEVLLPIFEPLAPAFELVREKGVRAFSGNLGNPGVLVSQRVRARDFRELVHPCSCDGEGKAERLLVGV